VIDEIKKEIKNIDITVEMMRDNSRYEEAIFKILDKYNNQEHNFKKITKAEIKDYLDTTYILLTCKTYDDLKLEIKKLIKFKSAWEELKQYNATYLEMATLGMANCETKKEIISCDNAKSHFKENVMKIQELSQKYNLDKEV
jgi:hypothetical protein